MQESFKVKRILANNMGAITPMFVYIPIGEGKVKVLPTIDIGGRGRLILLTDIDNNLCGTVMGSWPKTRPDGTRRP